MCDICGKSVRFGTLFFLYNKGRKERTIMNMKKLVDLLLEKEDLKDVPMNHIFKVLLSLFDIMANDHVFYEESL